ncbi:MAG: hypothetical protein M1833_001687 [Piccolia ochrophora]|nr:MAG: hypothetical protein M1833_001687 [Piccolia ochrophora]
MYILQHQQPKKRNLQRDTLETGKTRRNVSILSSPLEHSSADSLEAPGVPWRASPTASTVIRSGRIEFRHREEASTIEVFYDLFFVANLNTFTNSKDVSDTQTLAAYLAFFGLMWFTWLQVTLFDVRFGMDSLFERICRAVHFGVMTGFAVVGPNFFPKRETGYPLHDTFQTFSLILMVSRIVLVMQYGTVIWYTRANKQTLTPLLITTGALAVSAAIFLGIYFAFLRGHIMAHIGWYVVMFVEATVVFSVSAWWRCVSFVRTHLVSRMGLLTLIILGEGVIGTAVSLKLVFGGMGFFSASVIGQVVSVVTLLPRITPKGFVRQPFWAFLHFPLHVALLLVVEGIRQFTLWNAAVEQIHRASAKLEPLIDNPPDKRTLVNVFNSTVHAVYRQARNSATAQTDASYEEKAVIEEKLAGIRRSSAGVDSNETATALNEVYNTFVVYIVQTFSGETPESGLDRRGHYDADTQLQHITSTIELVFFYTFISAGCALIMLGILMAFGKKKRTRGDNLTIGTRITFGLALGLLALLASNDRAMSNFVLSSWVLPTIVLTIGLVIVIDNSLMYFFPQAYRVEPSKGGDMTDGMDEVQNKNRNGS